MSYDAARAALVTLLEGAAITTPITKAIGRVYADPPATVEDLPCLILHGSSGARDWVAHGLSSITEEHTERVRLLVRDADPDRAFNIVRAFRSAIVTLITAGPTLGANVRISRVSWDEPAGVMYGGVELTGMDIFVTFRVMAP